ncbi:hypothetical protein EAG_14800 [Camponotus floridanus]|uniref:Protein kinase domain-containing protein n=1 Tax=Camponotus floridanus TaxID=104421 RepID=E1ZWQ5_CAMFO|nr:hypothetical protein EAG_14800 [Camponotus floridanus]
MIPVIKHTLNERVLSTRSTDDKKDDEKSEKKLTVLESHGYILGKTIGAGSYATVKQVQNRVGFPKLPKVSRSCRSLISRILVPQSIRLRIKSIRNDAWLETSVVAQTSISGRFFELISAVPSNKESKVFNEHIISIASANFQKSENSENAIVQDNTKKPI